jgi:hypothetical protein
MELKIVREEASRTWAGKAALLMINGSYGQRPILANRI